MHHNLLILLSQLKTNIDKLDIDKLDIVDKTDYNTKIKRIEENIPNQDKFIATVDFNKLAKKSFHDTCQFYQQIQQLIQIFIVLYNVLMEIKKGSKITNV